ncbi:hypothetical protein E2C01_075547 [Portunus trituberculatus]|uniref:Uncharacterized protein n=1 Tax=Portunus trituberculatus TaxID=210409 RepID=A0A5B7IGE7_PORTR|nr:hypothetical protein [Portunus trituberculatus]
MLAAPREAYCDHGEREQACRAPSGGSQARAIGLTD